GIIDKVGGELANVFGNLVSRTIAMSNKYFGGKVENKNVTEDVDEDLKNTVVSAYEKVAGKMNEYKISDAISEVIPVFRRLNKYVDETAPWVLAKDEDKKDRLATVLYNLTEGIVVGASLMAPFMPETSLKTVKMLGTDLRSYEDIEKFGLYESGTTVTATPEILFARLDQKAVMDNVNAMIASRQPKEEKKAGHTVEPKPQIEFDDFSKVELRVAKVVACEKVEKSKKLLKLTVKLGDETRTVVSGIAGTYAPEYMVGKKLVMVTNLKPVKLCGIESQGMIVCAENDEGKISFLSPEVDIDDGSYIF
ncbi:MAG: methionine--tRNA ligase subunit beta, partial [Clostridia bacterium]|nr:methionine--tRNA ligase subunit beta [Clostridia bacterium]